MCGRYRIEDRIIDESYHIISILTLTEETGRHKNRDGDGNGNGDGNGSRDVFPSDTAPVIVNDNSEPAIRRIKWGIRGFRKGQLIINARSESVMEKPMFRNGILHSRLVVPSAGFYEWNGEKEKNTFVRPDGRGLYMAGFSVGDGEDERFTILTTAANRSVEPVHERMPLVLEENEIADWLFDENKAVRMLEKVPAVLERITEYEQLSMF